MQPLAGPSRPAVAPERFRRAMARFATGVTVVTTRARGVDHAMTANAFTSVSLDPLLVLIAVERVTRFHEAVLETGTWAVSVLGEGSRDASVWFATRGRPLEGQLEDHPHHGGARTGSAILDDALATLECETWATYDGGDHTLVVGRVLAVAEPHPEARPLVYFGGTYHGLRG